MITFTKIRWKNFLSTGNAFTEVPLSETPNVLIVGENGAGKSTILDALTFALFGKAFREINKPKLVNTINEKNCLVEIEFNTNGKNYKVIRGIKPNVFEIWCDGTCLNKDSASKDYQEHLEKFILKMTYKSFTQIVILGSASFVPFMKLKPADRRVVIEDLLDIQVFSVMNEIVKKRLQVNKESIEKNRIESIGKQEKKAFVERTIESLHKNNSEKQAVLEQELSKYKSKKDDGLKEIEDLNDRKLKLCDKLLEKSKISKKYNQFLVLKSQIESNHERHKSSIDFFHKNNSCPTCKQFIEEAFKNEEISRLKGRLPEFQSGIADLERSIYECLQRIEEFEEIEKDVEELDKHLAVAKSTDKTYTARIADLEKAISEITNSDTLLKDNEKELAEVEADIARIASEKDTLLKERQFIETAINLLKDGGIKTKIIKQYLPVINKLINKYLQQMGAFLNFNINENFEEIIKARYREEFSYHNFSEGEKLRIDLSVLFAWREIAKMRNSINTNLLIFDEILDRSLDANGTDDFLKIMWNLTSDTNVMVISHKQDQLVDKFQKVLRVVKKQNFSVVTT